MSSERVPSLRIRTPEGIGFSLLLAGPFVRFLAMLVDAACIACATSVLSTVLHFFAIISLDFAKALFIVGGFLLSVGYGISFEWFWRGQTLGKRLFRLRVMDGQGLHLQFGQVVIRNLVRTLDMFPVLYLLGGAVCFLSGKNQRLGDIAAGTIVVRTPAVAPPNLESLSNHKYNSLRQYRRQGLQLRRTVSGEEASIALRAVLRRDEMAPEARCVFFAELADYFRSRVLFPPEASEGLSDERFVRNVLDIVYASPDPARSKAQPR
ncbi:MAG TPA: RDD family protein [Geobacteraceae bacterium]|nr:RDD family protein [Geobacteraceae bacterium]